MSEACRLACWTRSTQARTASPPPPCCCSLSLSRRKQASSQATKFPAFSFWRPTRSSSVRRLRTPSQPSRLPITLPRKVRSFNRPRSQSCRWVASTPQSMSLWPPRYLVPACMTTSAPQRNGSCKPGGPKVASTRRYAPREWAFSAKAAML